MASAALVKVTISNTFILVSRNLPHVAPSDPLICSLKRTREQVVLLDLLSVLDSTLARASVKRNGRQNLSEDLELQRRHDDSIKSHTIRDNSNRI